MFDSTKDWNTDVLLLRVDDYNVVLSSLFSFALFALLNSSRAHYYEAEIAYSESSWWGAPKYTLSRNRGTTHILSHNFFIFRANSIKIHRIYVTICYTLRTKISAQNFTQQVRATCWLVENLKKNQNSGMQWKAHALFSLRHRCMNNADKMINLFGEKGI